MLLVQLNNMQDVAVTDQYVPQSFLMCTMRINRLLDVISCEESAGNSFL